MALSSVPTPDLSLFCGDLLPTDVVGCSEVFIDVKTLAQDGFTESWTTPGMPHLDVDQLSTLDQDSGLGDELFETSWLDTRVDLLDILEDPESVEPGIPMDGPELISNIEPSSNALQILQSVADASCHMLSHEEPSETASQPVCQDIQDVTTELGLADLLTTNFQENIEFKAELDLALFGEPILSPVSAEDVESLLSSEPGSPATDATAASLLCQMEVDQSSDTSVFENNHTQENSFTEIVALPDVSEPSDDVEWLPPTHNRQRSNRRHTPYEKAASHKPQDRKLRKKQQNKDAAIRYRQKKKAEQSAVNDEYNELMERNTMLHEKVDQMSKEIQYLKDLMAEVTRAQQLQIKLKAK